MKRNVLWLAVLLLIFPALGCAADRDVSVVTKALESKYSLHETHIPWIARAFMKPFLWGSGTKVSFSVFDHQVLPESASLDEMQNLAAKALGSDWSLFVRSYSRSEHERDVIYIKPDNDQVLMLIVAAEEDETSVVKLKMDPRKINKWVMQSVGLDEDHPKEQAGKQEEPDKAL